MASTEGVDLGGVRDARAQEGREGAATATASERIREARKTACIHQWSAWGTQAYKTTEGMRFPQVRHCKCGAKQVRNDPV